MAYYVAGDTIQEPYVSDSLATGLTFTRVASYVNGSAVVWNPTITEVGNGAYLFTYVSSSDSTLGSWVWIATASNGETVTWPFDLNATTATVTVVSASAASLTQTLAQLRRRLARELGDYTAITCTANGTTTTLIDTQRVNSATQDMKGRIIVSTNGTNTGLQRVVTSFTDSTGTLGFSALTAATAPNDTFDVFNKRGKGFAPSDYDAAINDAINDAFPLCLIEQVATITPAFDADAGGELTVPASFVYVHTVEYQDEDGYWHNLPRSSRHAGYGWTADAAAGELRILGAPGRSIDGFTVRLTGYGRQGTLSSDSDTCAIPAEWLIYKAAAALCLSAIDKDPTYGPKVSVYEGRANGLRTRIRTLRKSGSELVRAI
jgi:hypothetical protein